MRLELVEPIKDAAHYTDHTFRELMELGAELVVQWISEQTIHYINEAGEPALKTKGELFPDRPNKHLRPGRRIGD